MAMTDTAHCCIPQKYQLVSELVKKSVCTWMQAASIIKEPMTLIMWDHRHQRWFPKKSQRSLGIASLAMASLLEEWKNSRVSKYLRV